MARPATSSLTLSSISSTFFCSSSCFCGALLLLLLSGVAAPAQLPAPPLPPMRGLLKLAVTAALIFSASCSVSCCVPTADVWSEKFPAPPLPERAYKPEDDRVAVVALVMDRSIGAPLPAAAPFCASRS